jgi:hypothetical protein
MSYNPTRKLTVLALDPSVKSGGKILRSQIDVPNEYLEAVGGDATESAF